VKKWNDLYILAIYYRGPFSCRRWMAASDSASPEVYKWRIGSPVDVSNFHDPQANRIDEYDGVVRNETGGRRLVDL